MRNDRVQVCILIWNPFEDLRQIRHPHAFDEETGCFTETRRFQVMEKELDAADGRKADEEIHGSLNLGHCADFFDEEPGAFNTRLALGSHREPEFPSDVVQWSLEIRDELSGVVPRRAVSDARRFKERYLSLRAGENEVRCRDTTDASADHNKIRRCIGAQRRC